MVTATLINKNAIIQLIESLAQADPKKRPPTRRVATEDHSTIEIISRTLELKEHYALDDQIDSYDAGQDRLQYTIPVKIEINGGLFIVKYLRKGEKPRQLTRMVKAISKNAGPPPAKKAKRSEDYEVEPLVTFSVGQDLFTSLFYEIEAVQASVGSRGDRVFPIGPFLKKTGKLFTVEWQLRVLDSVLPWPIEYKDHTGYKCLMACLAEGDGLDSITALSDYIGPTSQIPQRVNTELFYDNIVQNTDLSKHIPPFSVEGMTSRLLPFQRRTVNWCLEKEGKRLSIVSDDAKQHSPPLGFVENLDPEIFETVVSPPLVWNKWAKNNTIMFNPYTGAICRETTLREHVRDESQRTTALQGATGGVGLIAEEMGLGKTVEVAALCLMNQRREETLVETNFSGRIMNKEFIESGLGNQLVWDPFLERQVVKSKTTLVISPASISSQWITELKAHAPQLSVMFYQPGTPGKGIGHDAENSSNSSNLTTRPSVREMIDYDVVVTTYSIISRELHSALFNPENRRTRSAKHGVDSSTSAWISPLVKIQFWRIILDEVQMVRTGVSPAARVAQLIPRVHAWGVTGTPVSHKMDDLRGILTFLRLAPFGYGDSRAWAQLMAHPVDFAKLWTSLSIRHTAAMVEDDLRLPRQSRVLVTVQFGLIEQSNYDHIYERFLDDMGVNQYGEADDRHTDSDCDDENSNIPMTGGRSLAERQAEGRRIIQNNFAKMRSWLIRLRQSCCHARIGIDNRRALNTRGADTLAQVLMAMIDQNESTLLGHKRQYHVSNLEAGQIYLEKMHEPKLALQIFEEGTVDVEAVVNALRNDVKALEADEQKRKSEDFLSQKEDINDIDFHELTKSKRLRSWLEILHRYYFFIATSFFQLRGGEEEKETNAPRESNAKADVTVKKETIKVESKGDDVEETDTEAQQKEEWQAKESNFYDLAEAIRRELLSEQYTRVTSMIENLSTVADDQNFVEVQDMTLDPETTEVGLVSRFLLDKVNELGEKLNAQAEVIDDWREQLISLLATPLVDTDADKPSGEEYEKSLDSQEYAFFYIETLRKMVADRDTAISGNEEIQVSTELTEFAQRLEDERIALLPIPRDLPKGVKAYDLSMTALAAKIKDSAMDAVSGSAGMTATHSAEATLLQGLNQKVKKLLVDARLNLEAVKKELNMFSDVFNARIEYYKQLQAISDLVQVLNPDIKTPVKKWLARCEESRSREEPFIRNLLSRQRYLQSLMTDHSTETETGSGSEKGAGMHDSRECVICQGVITFGCLTSCGHHFCRNCLAEWLKIKDACPVCKTPIRPGEVYKFTSSKPKLVLTHMDNETDSEAHKEKIIHVRPSSSENGEMKLMKSDQSAVQDASQTDPIYTAVPQSFEKEMAKISLASSYGSKLDTIVRHLIWLRQKNKSAQVVIFSQWREMLELLETALTKNDIKFATTSASRSRAQGKRTAGVRTTKLPVYGAEDFKSDPSIACFLLHAQSDAAGLTLVNATHVYLCEPLVNSGLEVQAVSRVHRIGQTRETIVWLFAIEGTVEKAVLQYSTKKRMDYLKSHNQAKSKQQKLSEHDLDVSNSHDLAQGLAKLYDKTSRGELVKDEDLPELLFKQRQVT